jgi:hypothetical protein
MLKIMREDIISRIDLNKVDWANRLTTNCYAYALGLDVPESTICDYAYVPGVISDNENGIYRKYTFSVEELIDCLESDFSFLGIDFREDITPEELEENEWLIALYVRNLYFGKKGRLDDYHFLRYKEDEHVWYHKNGYRGNVINVDFSRKTIYDLENCDLKDREFVKTYALKLK